MCTPSYKNTATYFKRSYNNSSVYNIPQMCVRQTTLTHATAPILTFPEVKWLRSYIIAVKQ